MRLLKQISLYSFVGFFHAGISFLLMPYLSHFIEPAGYGILSVVNSLVTILIPLIGLTASGLIFIEYYQCKDKKEFARIFSSIQAIPLLPAVFFFIVTFIFPSALCNLLEIPEDKSYWLSLSVVIALLSIYFESLLLFNIYEQKPLLYTKFTLTKVLLEVSLTLLFVSVFRLNWEGRLLSWMITTVVSFFFAVIYFRNRNLITTDIAWKHMRAGIIYGLPLILHTVGKFAITQLDRLFIANMVSIDEAGIYNIGYQVGLVILLFVGAAGNFYSPYLLQRLSNLTERGKHEIVKTTYIIILMFFLALVILSVASPLFFRLLVDEKYIGGIKYVFWTGLSYFFWGIYTLFTGCIFYTKQTKILGYLAVLNIALNTLLNYFLIQWVGPIGAAYATCISFFVTAVIVVWKSTRLFDLPWITFFSKPQKIAE